MTDRELLELAAKALHNAGDPNFRNYTVLEDCVCLELGCKRGAITSYWKPLTDDGDALRLAVKLNLLVKDCVEDWNWCREKAEYAEVCASYRRAIVMAAAELGRSME